MPKQDCDFSGTADDGSIGDSIVQLPKPSTEQLELMKSGIHIRENSLPPYNGTSYYREQYVQRENMFFSVEGKSYPPKRIYRAVYMLIPIWGFAHNFPVRVVGYKVQDGANPKAGAMEDFACLSNEHLTVNFSDNPSNL